MSAGLDWGLIVAVVSVGVTLALHYSRSIDYHERHLRGDPTYRAETAAKLRSARPGTLYRDALATALDWLDRRWGVPNSAQALGVCTVISLCYAWTAFFLAYALGGPGRLGQIAFLPNIDQPERAIAGILSVAMPATAFVVGRCLGRMERRYKARWLRRGRRQGTRRTHRALERRYRLVSAIVAAIMVGGLAVMVGLADPGASDVGDALVILVVFGPPVALGAAVGLATSRRLGHQWLRGPVAALAGAGAGAGAVALAVAEAVILAEAVALVGAVAVAVAGAGAGAGAGAVAVAGAGAIGAASALNRLSQGAYAGGMGVLLVLAISAIFLGVGARGQVVILWITFFFVLPVVNGFWDWGSWWVSRWLGRHLLGKLRDGGASGEWVWVVVWHGGIDLLLALLLLGTFAFFLAFAFESYNQFAEFQGGQTAYQLGPFIDVAAEAPWSEGLWLTVMLLSTLVPTALHGVMLLASPLAALFLATPQRAELAAALDRFKTHPEKPRILRQTSHYLHRRQLAWVGGAVLFLVVLVVILGFIALLHQGGLADLCRRRSQIGHRDGGMVLLSYCRSAATPGSSLPSSHSRKAPPAVEM